VREHLWAGEPEFEPLQDAWLEAAEAELGVKLPRALVAALRAQNGGPLRFDSHAASRPTSWAADHVPVPELFGIGPEPEEGLRDTPNLLDEWTLPGGLVLLCGEGPTWIALDYRASDPPTVIWIDPEESLELKLAGSFEEFLDGLVRADSRHAFGFPGVSDIDLLAKTLGDALGVSFSPGEDGYVAEHPEWKSEFADPALLRIQRNALTAPPDVPVPDLPADEPPRARFPEHPECEWLLRADIVDEHRQALVDCMARLPIPSVVLHLPRWDREPLADASELADEWDEEGDDLVSDLLSGDDDDDDDDWDDDEEE
jgi:hypothetical protein